jgi:UDPglucose 6-dehydrogenase/UDP-N-acetyl-D-galactosamine dehydrogenase
MKSIDNAAICVIGLGYVGIPLAEAFSRSLKVIGFDINANKVKKLTQSNHSQNLLLTNNEKEIGKADFIIICVPTPVTRSKEPDLSNVRSAATIAGRNMKKGTVVILESTVYPGVTEDIVKPILEKESGLKCPQGFKLAYSPERINPGDPEHSIEKVTKVIAGIDRETAGLVADLYGKVTPHIFKARDIKTAEAAKVIENIQRDLNIALVNELAIIFGKMGLNTSDVLDAAATKWNFHPYSPGLVGGHCIPVDPYYLVYKARELGYHSQVILSGRAINDYMPKHVAQMAVKALNEVGKVIKDCQVLIMGLTYKENVADIRETPVREIVKELEEYNVKIIGFDPLLSSQELESEIGIKVLKDLEEAKNTKSDCIILAVAHSSFHKLSLRNLKHMLNDSPVLIDIRGLYNPEEARKAGFNYRTL